MVLRWIRCVQYFMEYAVNAKKHRIRNTVCVGKEKQMNTRTKRTFSVAVCILFLFVTFASLFYIVKEENHHCTGEDCPICANIHQAEQTLKNIGNGAITIVTVNPVCILFALLIVGQFLLVSDTSLVGQKVRLND